MEPLPELYSIFQGEVAAVTDYGAFIKIPGCRKQGLVHRTQLSSCPVDSPAEVLAVGDTVWVKLVGREMKDDKLKLSLSMKVVHQGTGKDLDPNNVSLDQEERRKRTFRDYTSQKITLEAVLNTVCKKCGCKGHFAKECFMQPGGTKYSLIPEEEEEEGAAAGREGDKKISQAEESSKKRKKPWIATLLPFCSNSCPALRAGSGDQLLPPGAPCPFHAGAGPERLVLPW
ncbi:zinc finger CCHC domain-containing protein 17 isoform X2 [Vidua macroura]|uniref:zinc finger CCHC domain-containing protein 17 isoform X2 n=1 Tax=Vidua macroura TaxID=187451 RepID=UPI0023A90DA3|nr:zinc finger CCHC domain-containing protein 17 isoform X2 [Vidua macroura]